MSAQLSPTRVINGTELPAAGTWTIDPGHSEVGFIGRHFLVTRIRGRFVRIDGAITIAENPSDSSVVVDIDLASVESGDQARDDHLRSADFFDVERRPSARFRSTSVSWSGAVGEVVGDLTIGDIIREVALSVEFLGHVTDPWDNDRAIFTASATVNREDWGLTWNMPLANGGLLVSRDIDLEINVETVRQN